VLWMIQHFLISAQYRPSSSRSDARVASSAEAGLGGWVTSDPTSLRDMGHPFQEWTEEEENLHPGL